MIFRIARAQPIVHRPSKDGDAASRRSPCPLRDSAK